MNKTTNMAYETKAIGFSKTEILRQLATKYNSQESLSHYLDKYYLLKLIRYYEKVKASIDHAGSDNKKRNKRHFTRFMAERLSNSHYSPESVESAIWMLSEYSYKALEIDKRLHIASHLRHAARGESSLHMMKDFYRDHFFHTINVCLLGQILADARPQNSPVYLLVDNARYSMKNWYIAALLHDIGYAVDVFSSLKDWLRFFTSDAFNSLAEGIDRLLKEGNLEKPSDKMPSVDFKEFYECYGFDLVLDKPFQDHGLMGALHLKSLVANVQKNDSNVDVPEDAIHAIAVHNCQRIAIDYRRSPFSALLVLCDTLQNWQRPQFKHSSQGPSWMMSALNHNTNTIVPPQTTSAKLVTNLTFFPTDNQNVEPQFPETLILRLDYDDSINRDSFVFNIWLDALCNFQRVNFTRLPFNIIVQIKTPTYPLQNGGEETPQMDRLRDAAEDTHMAYLYNFFKAIQNTKDKIYPICEDSDGTEFYPDQAISYYYDKDEKAELLSFSLIKMDGQRQYMTNSLSRFRKNLKGWKHFHEDRFLVGDYSPWRHDYF